MANLSDFMPYVLPYVAGCTYPLAEQHIRDVCIDFCTSAPIVQLALDPIDAVVDQREYDLDAPTGSAVTRILQAWYQGRELATFKTGDSLSSQEQFNALFVGANTVGGTPRAIKQSGEAVFTFDIAPALDAPNAITLFVATKPTRKATTIADILLNDYAYEIGLGTVSRLMLLPGVFFNPALAAVHRNTYLSARTNARIRAEASFGMATTRVQPRRFQ